MARRPIKDPPKKDQQHAAEARRPEGFLARWSRRKSEASEETRVAKAAPELDVPGGEAPQASQSSPVVDKTDADMPPLESLDENSDYSEFMSPAVSERLRRMALRKLFHLPKFNVVDGLDDYADDYTTFGPLGEIITAHQRYQREVEQEKARQRQAQEKTRLTQQENDGSAPAAEEKATKDLREKEPPAEVADAHKIESDENSKKAEGDG